MGDSLKDREREELHKSIWSIADDLRGKVDGWDFKSYVLGMMFYRYISENLRDHLEREEHESGNIDFKYAECPDELFTDDHKRYLVDAKGFFMYPSQLFENVWKNSKNDENLNETLEKVFRSIEGSANGTASEGNFSGLFNDFDVNSNKLGSSVQKRNETLRKLMDGVGNMKLSSYGDSNIDAFGDAYEFLMAMYASNAGKSGGEFFTPQEVSELLTRIVLHDKNEINKIYDMCCGSGSLLLKAAKILGGDRVGGYYGQEVNITTYNLCRINMFLHNLNFHQFNIVCEDTLTHPQHEDEEPFDAIVSNPPYSIKWIGDNDSTLINDHRFSPAGVLAPKSKADLAFIMHALSYLSPKGTAAIVCFPGIMYRGGAEQKIRKYLVDGNYVDAIIQLPSNLFFGTSIATCIMVLKKSKKDTGVLFIDASKEFIKATNNNKLSKENIDKIVDIWSKREDVEYLSKLADYEEIKKENYNLSVSTYVEQEDTREKIDINELNLNLKGIVSRIDVLRKEIDQIIDEIGDYVKED